MPKVVGDATARHKPHATLAANRRWRTRIGTVPHHCFGAKYKSNRRLPRPFPCLFPIVTIYSASNFPVQEPIRRLSQLLPSPNPSSTTKRDHTSVTSPHQRVKSHQSLLEKAYQTNGAHDPNCDNYHGVA